MKPAWVTCGNCVNYEPFGDGGECRKNAPVTPTVGHSGRYPQVSFTEPGCGEFVLNGQPLFDRLEELQSKMADMEDERASVVEGRNQLWQYTEELQRELAELQREPDDVTPEMLSEWMTIAKRKPLTTVEG